MTTTASQEPGAGVEPRGPKEPEAAGKVRAANLGFPRIGARRELKRALERYWAGDESAAALGQSAAALRKDRLRWQADCGIDEIPSNDFSLYDHVLDTAVLVGAVPDRYAAGEGPGSLEAYFAMARGGTVAGRPVRALEMTKWFDTNYHFLVPELEPGRRFELDATKPLAELAEADALGIPTRPVILGPISFLVLSRRRAEAAVRALWADGLVAVYEQLLAELAGAGAHAVQLDEPALGLDLDEDLRAAYPAVVRRLAEAAPGLELALTTYFSGLRENLPLACSLPVGVLHLDGVAEPGQIEEAIALAPEGLALSLGVVDGRNVWRSDLPALLDRLEPLHRLLGGGRPGEGRLGGGRLLVAPSCSLLHLPVDLSLETGLPAEVAGFLAFARQRLEEVATLARALNEGREAVAEALAASAQAAAARSASPLVVDPELRRRLAGFGPEHERRALPYAERAPLQHERLAQRLLPTTTIGSLPQTPELRRLRARFNKGEVDQAAYEGSLREEITAAIRLQERIGLDVLVHGEFERTDMVEYFAGHLAGFVLSEHGWVQSYGSRCVRPPILFGDVRRPSPITPRWTGFAQSITDRPVKGMLTGPLTMLSWSFVRDDQPLEETARQLALAVRDEAADLEAAGHAIVQVDEPALREGLPLRGADQADYLDWAVRAFRLATSGLSPEVQLHTHMCYAEVDEIVDTLAALDVDVISIEASRSKMAVLEPLSADRYPGEVGPGLFDVHSPRVPSVDELVELLEAALAALPAERLWVNPDCGLKTRTFEEVGPALANMVEAARRLRSRRT